MKLATSVTTWNDAVGKRISITYSEINEETGTIIADNKRVDRIVTNADVKNLIDELMEYAQQVIEA
jgi:hypothetical protein